MKKAFFAPAFIAATICLSSGYAQQTVTPNTAQAQDQKKFNYEAKNFENLIGNVPGLSDDLLKMHFKLYEGYVKNSNLVLNKLNELDATGQNKTPEYAGLKRILGWEFNGMLLHEYYFEQFGSPKTLDSKDPLYVKIQEDFGSFDNWKKDYVATGLMRGIGWVITYVDPKSGKLINEWINEHDVGHLSGGNPLLIMDVFEHAYITEFALDRAKYIDVFFNNINWELVSKRFQTKK